MKKTTPFLMTKNGRLMRRSRLEESNQDETMLIVASLLPFAHFMHQSKPAAVENDRLGAAAERSAAVEGVASAIGDDGLFGV
jgi:hypothetical protein